MVYQYDKHFEYGCWMTSIPTMSHIVTFLGYSEFPNWLPWQPIQILQYPKSIQQNLKMWVMVGILVIQQQYQEVYHIDIPLPPHCDAMLGVPMEGELAKTLDSVSFSREEAKELVIGKVLGKSALITEIPHDAPGFNPDSGSDDDALDYAVLDPNYEEHGFDAEGLVMTQEQRQEAAATAFMEESQGAPEEDHPMEEDPVPPYVPAEPETGGAFATSTLQVSLEDPVSSSPTQALTPSSAVESIPSSEAVSAASSSTPEITRARRSTVAVPRSRNYRGPYVQPASSSSSSRSRAPTRRSPSPRRYSPPRRSSARPYSS